MEQETLFTSVKWDILQSLSQGKKAPLELADQFKTSVSNVSQSLRFLELGGLVKSERIGNRDRGQPRVVYSLASDKAFFIVASNNFSTKKLLELDEKKKALLKIWNYDDKALQYYLEEAFHELRSELQNISAVLYDRRTISELRLILVPKEGRKISQSSLKEISLTDNGAVRRIKFDVVNSSSNSKNIKDAQFMFVIYDLENSFGGELKERT